MSTIRNEQLEALNDSIAHWERLRDGNAAPGEDTRPIHCACCARYLLPDTAPACVGCPIREFTGKSGCEDTPYQHAEQMHEEYGPESPEFQNAAAKEVDFLVSVGRFIEQNRAHGGVCGGGGMSTDDCSLCHGVPICGAPHDGYVCTRKVGHTGPHAACGYEWDEHPICEWSNDEVTA